MVGWDFLLFLKTLQFHIAPRNVAHSGVHPPPTLLTKPLPVHLNSSVLALV